jgi:hypothetical protein
MRIRDSQAITYGRKGASMALGECRRKCMRKERLISLWSVGFGISFGLGFNRSA